MNEDTIRNALDFYLLANNLKYTLESQKQSLANQVYGSIVLAVAINSEYNRTDNIGKTIRTILLGIMNEFHTKELDSILNKLSNGHKLKEEIQDFYSSSKSDGFAFECEIIEVSLNYFFDYVIPREKLQKLSIEELFEIAKKYGFIGRIGPDDKKNFEIFRFYYLNLELRNKTRTGWDANHWNISNERVENIAEHIIGTIALAIAIESIEKHLIDLDIVCAVLAIHEIGEIKIGDIAPYDGITLEEKEVIEHQAMKEILGNLSLKDEMYASLLEFDKHENYTYEFARYCDKLEADIQSRIYQDMGCHHSLSDQENNIAFKSEKVKKLLQGNVSTAFDMWYEMDKGIYKDSETFTKILTYIKNTKLK